ncbi:putative sulfate exporter family transporter, partial [Rhodococcus sp. CX]|uniref:putative sulfate exporter family transporter n=1 Tax=Rhodococcus sp. CX TaxID=2789880 RepID=UPI001E5B2746
LLGVAVANTVLRREGATATRMLAPGTAVAAKNLLRVGVALLGLQLLVPDVLALGWGTLAVAVAVVALGIAGTLWLGARLGL